MLVKRMFQFMKVSSGVSLQLSTIYVQIKLTSTVINKFKKILVTEITKISTISIW